MLLPFTRELFKIITPLNLLFALLFLFWGKKPARQVILTEHCSCGCLVLIEAAGVNTGKIFGVYTYGRTLGPALLNTPGDYRAELVFAYLLHQCYQQAVMGSVA